MGIDVSIGHKSRGLTTAELNSLPNDIKIGLTILDTTLGYVVTWDGTSFVKSYGDKEIDDGTGRKWWTRKGDGNVDNGNLQPADIIAGYRDGTKASYVIAEVLTVPIDLDDSETITILFDSAATDGGAGGVSTDADNSLSLGSDLKPYFKQRELLDDDTFATATATKPPSSESVKAYVAANAVSQGFNPFTMFKQGSNEFLCFATCIGRAGGTVTHGSPIEWEILDNASGHGSSMFRTITDYGSGAMKFNYPEVKTVQTLLIGADEGLARHGISFGPTVSFDNAGVFAYKPGLGNFLIKGNGTTWVAYGESANLFQLDGATSGFIRLGLTSFIKSFDANAVTITYCGNNNYRIKRIFSGLGSSVIGFKMVDIATNTDVTTAPTTGDAITIGGFGTNRYQVNLSSWVLNNGSLGNAVLNSVSINFWCIGFFELYMKVIPISSSILRVKWQSKGAITYKLQRSTEFTVSAGKYVLTTPTDVYIGTALEFNDTGLSADTMYYYRLANNATDAEITQFNCKTLV